MKLTFFQARMIGHMKSYKTASELSDRVKLEGRKPEQVELKIVLDTVKIWIDKLTLIDNAKEEINDLIIETIDFHTTHHIGKNIPLGENEVYINEVLELLKVS
jgi:hypothetical protein